MIPSHIHLVGVAIPTLLELRNAVLAASPPDTAIPALREAGFAGGDSVYSAFEQWLGETEGTAGLDPRDLALDDFATRATSFFRNAGWGDVSFAEVEDEGVAAFDIERCWEGSAEGDGCHLTTGLLSAFFGRIAGYPVAVLETECCKGEGSRCRFLMGNSDVMHHVWMAARQAPA